MPTAHPGPSDHGRGDGNASFLIPHLKNAQRFSLCYYFADGSSRHMNPHSRFPQGELFCVTNVGVR
jgi:hypothetical protein